MDPDHGFRDAVFLGGRPSDKRDPERLRLFAERLLKGERVSHVLPCRDSALLLTDRRLLELRPRLVAHGAWNVMKFDGFSLNAEIPRGTATGIRRRPVPLGPGGTSVGGETLEIVAQGKAFTFIGRGGNTPQRSLRDGFPAPRDVAWRVITSFSKAKAPGQTCPCCPTPFPMAEPTAASNQKDLSPGS
ncbi:MAG TPA: hypothetical protein VJ400_05290 [Thermoplasmata archaeon]|nr:hypothetical protein [Thermoplasmata archaeon]